MLVHLAFGLELLTWTCSGRSTVQKAVDRRPLLTSQDGFCVLDANRMDGVKCEPSDEDVMCSRGKVG